MLNQYSRTELLIGKDNVEKIKSSKIALFGIGGVGSYTLEALCRAGVGQFILVDHDEVDQTNINRQIIATHSTIGKPKVEVAKERVLSINPDAEVKIYQEFFSKESSNILDDSIAYVIDCVDTVTAKIELVIRANRLNIPIISSMGTGNKLDPTRFEVTDIYKTSVCPLAKVMRKELKARGINKLKVIYSKEEPIKLDETLECSCKNGCICPPGTKRKCTVRNQVPGSISFVPSVAGLIISGEVVKDIIEK